MKIFVLLSLILAILAIGAVPNQTVTVPDDPDVLRREFTSNSVLQYVEFIYFEDSSGTIVYERQSPTGTLEERRAATDEEIFDYRAQIDFRTVSEARSGLRASPEPGQNYGEWVSNREAELLQCEVNMSNGQLMNFNDLGAGGQNTTVREIMRCLEINSFVQRKVIRNLCDLLTVEGILVCE